METFLKIQITPAKNGIKVLVGCHEFVYQQGNLKLFLADLSLYLEDPAAARDMVFKRWGIKDEASPDQAITPGTSRAIRRSRSEEEASEGQEETKEVRGRSSTPPITRDGSR